VQEKASEGTGVTLDWKPFEHRSKTGRNRLGLDQSEPLISPRLWKITSFKWDIDTKRN
jgi:hypothetical protein